MDIIVYVIGSACDGRHYMYKGQKWESKRELDKQLKEDGVPLDSVQLLKEPESWEDTKKALIKYTDKILEDSGAIDYEGYLTGHSNFRYDVATILPYKGNRSTVEKPHHYDAIRQFLVDTYEATVTGGMEADDALGLRQKEEGTIIVSNDKDLDVIPYAHYNWDKDKSYTVSVLDADRNFYCQILTGDRTDNILGLHGVGVGSQLVKNIRKMEDPLEMHDYTLSQYRKRFGNYAEEFMKETARLLWILQERKNLFMN